MPRIELSNKKGVFTKVDAADARFLRGRSLQLNSRGYVIVVFGKAYKVPLHIVLMPKPPRSRGLHVDHANRNRLDNRRSNLRVATASQNAANHTRRADTQNPYEGVRELPSGRWQARYGSGGITIGTFDTLKKAAAARNWAVRAVYGEFAPRNSKLRRRYRR